VSASRGGSSCPGGAFRHLVLAAAAALLLVPAAPAESTTILAMPFADQCAGAETIVVGTVRAVVSRRSLVAPSFFETLVTVAVDEVVAGSAAAEVTLRLAGGEVGAVRQSIDGMPEFAVGERYVVFLEPEQNPPLISPITGFNQGLYRVERADGLDVVRDYAGRALSASVVTALAAGGAERRESNVPSPGAAAPSGAVVPSPGTAAAPSLEAFVSAIHAARPR
jgi:hypothetical protein